MISVALTGTKFEDITLFPFQEKVIEEIMDISNASIEDIKGFFDYGFISHKDLEEELKKRKLFLNTHGEIIPIDGLYEDIKKALFLLRDGEIDLEGFMKLFGDHPSEVFSKTHDLVVSDLINDGYSDDPIKKKRWEILDFS